MKTILLCCSIFLMLQTALGQNIELFLGGGFNKYYTTSSTSSYDRSYYERGEAFTAGLSIAKIRLLGIPVRVSARIAQNQGYVNISNGGRGGGRNISGDFRRTQLGLGFYPLNISLLNRIEISLGAELQFLLAHRETGEILVWNLAQPSFNQKTALTEGTITQHSVGAGVSGRIGYKIKLSENWYLLPRYEFFMGLFQDISLGADAASSTRHFLKLGLIRALK